jgi:hypothetical protein
MTMALIAITQDVVTSSQPEKGYAIYFEPAPLSDDLPTVWLDLHVSAAYYHNCEDEMVRRPFLVSKNGDLRFIRIRPRSGVRLITQETVGLDCEHSAVVTNVASRAKHGVIVAPGKVDPGFKPRQLVLVVFNQSSRVIVLHEGDKIASIAFLMTTAECRPTASRGHANGALPDFELTRVQRLKNWLATRDYHEISYDFVKGVVYLVLAALLLHFFGVKTP